jgi:catechol 2,3-dioxygenase-like lactoylglutathione lyase family enzyme
MPRIDHVAVETPDPDEAAGFYERVLGARIVKEEGHPIMAYLGATGFAFHEPGGPGPHTAVRVSEEERPRSRNGWTRPGSSGASETTASPSGSSSATRMVAPSRRSPTAPATTHAVRDLVALSH